MIVLVPCQFWKASTAFFHTASTQHSTDLLISVELKFHQVINGQSILNIVMDRDSAIVLCHLVLRTNLLSSALHQADALYICSPFGNWNSALSWNPRWGWLCSADAAGKKNCWGFHMGNVNLWFYTTWQPKRYIYTFAILAWQQVLILNAHIKE